MANEIKLTASLTGYKSSIMSSAIGRAVTDLASTMSGNVFSQGSVSVGFAAAEAIPLAEVVNCGMSFFMNHDATNFVTIRNGASGAVLVKLKAGEAGFFPLVDNAVPYWIADTAACLCEYLIFSR
jgi:hypothetical protein